MISDSPNDYIRNDPAQDLHTRVPIADPPAAFVTEELVLCVQCFRGTEIAEATRDGAILLNVEAEVQESLITGSDRFTPQASRFICQCALHDTQSRVCHISCQTAS